MRLASIIIESFGWALVVLKLVVDEQEAARIDPDHASWQVRAWRRLRRPAARDGTVRPETIEATVNVHAPKVVTGRAAARFEFRAFATGGRPPDTEELLRRMEQRLEERTGQRISELERRSQAADDEVRAELDRQVATLESEKADIRNELQQLRRSLAELLRGGLTGWLGAALVAAGIVLGALA